jgi:nucleolysin TIA-1/TIAR
MQCSWGSKPTLQGTLSLPLPAPPPMGPFQGVLPAGINQGYSAADLLAYQRQILTQASTGRALLPLPHQQGMGLGMGQALMGTQGSRGVYDGFQPGAGLAGGHERMYY